MDVKRSQASSASSGDSSCSSPASPAGSPAADSPAPPPGAGRAATPAANAFANDGSFMEIFKKKMEEEEKRRKESQQSGGDGKATEQGQASGEKKALPVTSFVGKRRGGVFLKTGIVQKKKKQDTDADAGKSDAWLKYMAEVQKYKAHQCGDDDKTRPLVK